MDKNTKNVLSLIALMLVTVYCMATNYWVLWAGIALMLFADNFADSLKEWLDRRQKIYLDTIRIMHSPRQNFSDRLLSVEQSIARVERRIDTGENTEQETAAWEQLRSDNKR